MTRTNASTPRYWSYDESKMSARAGASGSPEGGGTRSTIASRWSSSSRRRTGTRVGARGQRPRSLPARPSTCRRLDRRVSWHLSHAAAARDVLYLHRLLRIGHDEEPDRRGDPRGRCGRARVDVARTRRRRSTRSSSGTSMRNGRTASLVVAGAGSTGNRLAAAARNAASAVATVRRARHRRCADQARRRATRARAAARAHRTWCRGSCHALAQMEAPARRLDLAAAAGHEPGAAA